MNGNHYLSIRNISNTPHNLGYNARLDVMGFTTH